MEKLLVNYNMQAIDIANPDGTLQAEVADCYHTDGPGTFYNGYYPKSVTLGPAARIKTGLPIEKIDTGNFYMRLVFKSNGNVTGRQNLVESTHLPISLYLTKTGNYVDEFQLVVLLMPFAHGWHSISSLHHITLSKGAWYVAEVVYQKDTLALFINDKLVAIQAFTHGAIAVDPTKKDLFLGTWTNGSSYRFNGSFAAFSWQNGIPAHMLQKMETARTLPEWHISYKYSVLSKNIELGAKAASMYQDKGTGNWVQEYEKGLIIFNPQMETTYEMYGATWEHHHTYLSTFIALTSNHRWSFGSNLRQKTTILVKHWVEKIKAHGPPHLRETAPRLL